MASINISEEKLNKIISESINKVLSEAMEDEGVGAALGNAYQWTKNKFNNFKKDFEAGRRNQRVKNARYTPFDYYRKKGYSEDQINAMRNMDAGTYSNGRKDFVQNDMYPNYQNNAPQGDEPRMAPNGNETPQAASANAAQNATYQNPNARSNRHSLADLTAYFQNQGAKRIGKYDADLIVKALQAYGKSTGMKEGKE